MYYEGELYLKLKDDFCEFYQLYYHISSFQIDGISIGSLDDVPGGAVTTFFKSIRETLDFDFEDENEGKL